MDLEALALTADLNSDREAEVAYATALEAARRDGYSGEIQGPASWTVSGGRVAPVEVFAKGKRVDGFIRWLED